MKIFSNTFVLLFLISFSLFADDNAELKITALGDTYVEAAIPGEVLSIRFENLGEIYDIYEDMLIIGENKTYVRLVDSVYLVEVSQGTLIFNYIWEGEKKYLKVGYYLAPTGHIYKAEVQEIKKVAQKGTASLFPADGVQLFHFIGGGIAIQSGFEKEETTFSGIVQTELTFLLGNLVAATVRGHTNELFNLLRLDLELSFWRPFFQIDFMKYNFAAGVTLPLVDDNFEALAGGSTFGLFYTQFGLIFIIPISEQGFFRNLYVGLDFQLTISVANDGSSLLHLTLPLKIGYRIF